MRTRRTRDLAGDDAPLLLRQHLAEGFEFNDLNVQCISDSFSANTNAVKSAYCVGFQDNLSIIYGQFPENSLNPFEKRKIQRRIKKLYNKVRDMNGTEAAPKFTFFKLKKKQIYIQTSKFVKVRQECDGLGSLSDTYSIINDLLADINIQWQYIQCKQDNSVLVLELKKSRMKNIVEQLIKDLYIYRMKYPDKTLLLLGLACEETELSGNDECDLEELQEFIKKDGNCHLMFGCLIKKSLFGTDLSSLLVEDIPVKKYLMLMFRFSYSNLTLKKRRRLCLSK